MSTGSVWILSQLTPNIYRRRLSGWSRYIRSHIVGHLGGRVQEPTDKMSSSMQRLFWCTVIVVTCCNVPTTTLSLVSPRKVAVVNRSVSPPSWPSFRRYTTSLSSSTSRDPPRRMGELTPSEQVVHDTLCAGSTYSFRIVVVGSGAILETTVPRLGPHFKILQSPSTGTYVRTRKSCGECYDESVCVYIVYDWFVTRGCFVSNH